MTNRCANCEFFSLDNILNNTGRCRLLVGGAGAEKSAFSDVCRCFEARNSDDKFTSGIINLKPCPFCGKEVQFRYVMKSTDHCIETMISCSSCSYSFVRHIDSVGEIGKLLNDIAALVSKWNTRK